LLVILENDGWICGPPRLCTKSEESKAPLYEPIEKAVVWLIKIAMSRTTETISCSQFALIDHLLPILAILQTLDLVDVKLADCLFSARMRHHPAFRSNAVPLLS
jgi:hypothetical protein